MSYEIRTNKTWAQTFDDLSTCFERWRVREWDAERYYHGSRSVGLGPDERRVLVWWKGANGARVTVTLDTQETPAKNLRALFLCIDDLRMLELRGLHKVAASAYLQLEAPKAKRDPWEVLELRPNASIEMIEAAYRAQSKKAHPDKGGSDEAFAELQEAYEDAKRIVGA